MSVCLSELYPFMKESAGYKKFTRLSKRGADFLKAPLPFLGGAMTWVSTPQLVAAMANAGCFGVLASGAMEPSMLEDVIVETKALTKQAFGVNIIVMHPKRKNLLEVCKKHGISHVVFAGGMPSSEDITFVKNYGGRVVTLTPSAMILKRLMRVGVDAFIIEGSEAGGHIGPVSTSVLAQEILLPFSQAQNEVQAAGEREEKEVDTPLIFVAGGIGHGAMIAHYMSMGAVGCQMGTRFVCAQESPAHPAFKKAFIRASARDAVVSMQLDARLPVIPVRALKNKGMQRFMEKQKQVVEALEAEQKPLLDAQLEIEHFWAGALRRAVCDGDVENGSLMAGQSVGLIKREQPVKDIIGQLLQEVLCALTQS